MSGKHRATRLAGVAVVMAGLVALGGCWWHESDVPAILPADRAQVSPIEDGVYCGLEADEDGMALEEDCSRFAWDADQHRIHIVEILDDGALGQEMWVDVAPMARGLLLLQTSNTENAGAERRYQLYAALARPEGVVVVPLPPGEMRNAIAEDEGLALEPGDADDDGRRIVAGEPAAIRRMAERSAIAWLDGPDTPEVDRFAPFDPDAEADAVAPRYTLRVDALDPDVAPSAAIAEALDALHAALMNAADAES